MDKQGYLFTRGSARPRLAQQNERIFVMLLKRVTQRKLKDYFQSFKRQHHQFCTKLRRLQKISRKNNLMLLALSWQKIKTNTIAKRCNDRILKNVVSMHKRAQTSSLRYGFDQIHKHSLKMNNYHYERLIQSRGNIMIHVLKKIFTCKKKSGWAKLRSNQLKTKTLSRIMGIHLIFRHNRKKCQLEAWNRLLKMKAGSKYNEKQLLEELQIQLQDLKVQVENKNSHIGRLQDEITDLKQQSPQKPHESSNFMNIAKNSRSQAGLLKGNRNNKFNSSFDRDSNDGSIGKDDRSFGSLLGKSFVSYRSKGSLSKDFNDSRTSKNACGCGYREKYQKYKASGETLRKQIDIIKTELQFTKDMNEHMENEIRAHLGDNEKDRKIDKLRQQLKQSQKQKDGLKEKILKYEKYVNKLKAEFKIKIQEIYRRVKKNS